MAIEGVAFARDVEYLLAQKFVAPDIRVKVNVTEAYNVTGYPKTENADNLVATVTVDGLHTDRIALIVALGADKMANVTKTPQEVAQMSYASMMDLLKRDSAQSV